jgi:hypothetical protein
MDSERKAEEKRKLTDADVEAVATALWKKVTSSFFSNLGMGVWALIWRGIIVGLLAIAAYGAMKHGGQ